MTMMLLPARWFVRPAQALVAGGVALLLAVAWGSLDGDTPTLLIVEATASASEARAQAGERALALLQARTDIGKVELLDDRTMRERLALAGARLPPGPLPLPTMVEARLRAGVLPNSAIATLRHVPGLRVDVVQDESRNRESRLAVAGIAAAAILALAALADARARAPAMDLLERLGAAPGQRWAHLLLPAGLSVTLGACGGSLIGALVLGDRPAHLARVAAITVMAATWTAASLFTAWRLGGART